MAFNVHTLSSIDCTVVFHAIFTQGEGFISTDAFREPRYCPQQGVHLVSRVDFIFQQ